MIAKRVPNKKNTSSIKRLVDYLNDPEKQGNIEKPDGDTTRLVNYIDKGEGLARISNCSFDNLGAALKEIQATQERNTRAKGNKNYHLVLSFKEGERLERETLNKIEDDFIEELGFGEHQRISAVHDNTNNLHIHIAINKVHPTKHTISEPFYDKYKMSDICHKIERKYGLQVDNRINRENKKAFSKASDIEAHTGEKSFLSYLKEKTVQELLSELENHSSWKNVHRVLHKNGLQIRKRGAGFVFQDLESGICIKASAVHRDFSKRKLEGNLGPLKESKVKYPTERKYSYGPKQPQDETSQKLWDLYLQEKEERINNRKELFEKFYTDRGYLRSVFKDINRRWKETKLSSIMTYRQKREVYAALQIEKIQTKKTYTSLRNTINEAHPRISWTSFLIERAERGDERALQVLRYKSKHGTLNEGVSLPHKSSKNSKREEGFISGDWQDDKIVNDIKYAVDKRGRVRYTRGREWVVDSGGKVIPGATDRKTVSFALELAVAKYGQRFTINGSTGFVEMVKKEALKTGLTTKGMGVSR